MSRAFGTFQAFGFTLVIASAVIYAGCGGGSGELTGPPGGVGSVDSLVLNLDSAEIIVGDTVRLTAEARDANGRVVPGVGFTFASSDPAVATVSDDGLVTAVDLGEAEIAVSIAGEASVRGSSVAPSYSAVRASPVRIVRSIILPRVVISPGEQTLEPGATSQYSALLTDIRGRELRSRPATWSSSNPSVAAIDNAGLVTAASEGDTEIKVSFAIPGRGGEFSERVVLHVVVCGGIFRVATWDATAEVKYKASGSVPATQSAYDVDQFSRGAVTLEKVPGQAGTESMVWEGKTSGEFSEVGLNNLLTFPVPPPVSIGRTEEVRTGRIQDGATAVARLTVKKSSAGSACTYDFEWGDYFVWSITNNQGAPPIPKAGPTAGALLVGRDIGPRPEDGHWVLGSVQPGSEIPIPARAFPNPSTSYYVPGSTIGVSLIIALGGASATYGEAKLVHLLQGFAR